MSWYPRRTSKPAFPPKAKGANAPGIPSALAARVMNRINTAKRTDPRIKELTAKLKALRKPPQPHQTVSPAKVMKYDVLCGRTTSYYAAESVALSADLEHTIYYENRRLLEEAIQKRERELARKVCKEFVPLLLLPPNEKSAVLAAAGLGPGILEEDGSGVMRVLPTVAAGRWKIVVRLPRRGDDGWEPDAEVMEVIQEESELKEGFQKLNAAEVARAGFRPVMTWGSSGKDG